ncbi:hypothetical protein LDENG_00063790 [Lucifuga dentata]|nr:hypothetical protein LDENG_00063790 [Lucifuga dentata]
MKRFQQRTLEHVSRQIWCKEAKPCPGWWDHLNCWPHAVVGEVVSQPCPSFLHATGRVFRNCTESGWTDLYPPHEIACDYGFNESLPLEVSLL